MKIKPKRLDGVFEITLDPKKDHRGFFMRTYDQAAFRDLKLNVEWLQDSQSYTQKKNTVRGLHVSLHPSVEGKYVQIVRGSMQWVVVDLRLKSKTFGEWDSVLLTEENRNAIYIEKGFGHGCISLTDDCYLAIKADTVFSNENGTGIVWNDPDLKIGWMVKDPNPIISDKDRSLGTFAGFKNKFKGITV